MLAGISDTAALRYIYATYFFFERTRLSVIRSSKLFIIEKRKEEDDHLRRF
jgi:hypothetical protein